MKVICFDEVPASTRGGQEWSMLDECVGLAGRGHEVSLGYVVAGDLLPRYVAAGVRPVQVSRLILPTGQRVRGVAQFASSVARAALVPADLICVNQYHDTLFGNAVARIRRVPLVCHLRLMPPSQFCGQWRLGVRGVTRFIAVSAAVRDAWADRGFDPSIIDVVHDGIDIERFKPIADRAAVRRSLGVPEDAYVLAFAGRLDRQKRIEAMLEAFARLELPATQARLLIAGRRVVNC
jgi:glycosyltransferase involved in cell wall biosynthesis